MSGRKPISSLISSLSRPSLSSHYICGPCQRQLQQQLHHRQQPQQSPSHHHQTRSLHDKVQPGPVPRPTAFVPDVSTFLTLIGRKMNTHAAKFETWDKLFTLSSPQLKDLGIEPARSRRYLLRWREKFRRGDYGIGGDMTYVEDGTAEMRVVEVPSLDPIRARDTSPLTASISSTPGMQKLIVNVPRGASTYQLGPGQTTRDLKKPAQIKLVDGHLIVGSYVQPVKGSNGRVATLKVVDGLWEDKRGRKLFGGERRRAETLHKMRVAERKKNER